MSSAQPRVSVVVTCFNYGRYVAGCLDSILAQTHGAWEIVVVDDGSTDDSAAIIARYTSDPRVRLVRQNNRGQAAAKNVGVAQSSGDLVAFLDADDTWAKDKLARQVPLFADAGVAVVYSRAAFIDAGARLIQTEPDGRVLQPKRGNVTRELFFDNFVHFSSSIVRRSALEGLRAPAFDESLAMGIDWDLWLRLSVHHRFEFVDAPLINYRIGHPGQMSKNLEVRQACSDRIMDRFLENHPGALTKDTVRKAWAYTYANRGMYFERRDSARSRRCYLRSIRLNPIQLDAYKGLVRSGMGWFRRGPVCA